MKVHGILTIESPDKSEETLVVSGADLLPLRERGFLRVEAAVNEPPESLSGVIGHVTAAHIVTDPSTEPDDELKALAGGKPFIKVEAEIFTHLRGRRDGQIAYGRQIADALHQSPPHSFYFGVSGTVVERDGQLLKKVVIREVILTEHGVHESQRVIAGPLKGC